jgi:regulator of sirC expression with transglutaminase-like and TPR domain
VIRERGELAMRLGAKASALEDLERSIALEPEGPGADHAKRLLAGLEKPSANAHLN